MTENSTKQPFEENPTRNLSSAHYAANPNLCLQDVVCMTRPLASTQKRCPSSSDSTSQSPRDSRIFLFWQSETAKCVPRYKIISKWAISRLNHGADHRSGVGTESIMRCITCEGRANQGTLSKVSAAYQNNWIARRQ